MKYTEFSIREHATIQVRLAKNLSLRAIARMLEQNPSTISREVKRNTNLFSGYQARNTNHKKATPYTLLA